MKGYLEIPMQTLIAFFNSQRLSTLPCGLLSQHKDNTRMEVLGEIPRCQPGMEVAATTAIPKGVGTHRVIVHDGSYLAIKKRDQTSYTSKDVETLPGSQQNNALPTGDVACTEKNQVKASRKKCTSTFLSVSPLRRL
jgi:hypothetical protein